MSKTYDIYLVQNGRICEFNRGITRGCEQWGNDMTLDEVRQRYIELADEKFRREGGEYDRIWAACAEAHPEQADEGFIEPEDAFDKYVSDLTAEQDPLKWDRIEWKDDLLWVTIRLHPEEA